jgi:hypothetical protein
MRGLCFAASKQLRAIILAGTIVAAVSIAKPSIAEQPASPAAPRPLVTQPIIFQPLIVQPINESQLTTLHGNTHPLARPQFDLGTAPATLAMQRMLLVLKRNPQQESALDQLLNDQQDKSSPNYHKWLTPEEYGKQFGPTDADLQTITAWLQSHGFQVGSTRGRTVLEFSGSASQVQEAFHTTIHKYIVNGEQHWANSSDPQIPTALTPAIAGVASLNNFSRKAMNLPVGRFSRDKTTGRLTPINPLYTFPSGCIQNNEEQGHCNYGIGPYDFATIYNVLPLWNANINGTGQTIAIVGESNINPQDIADFRALFGLPANSSANGNPLNIILNGPDPGIQGDESEADIDVTWSSSVAPYATIDFVVSQSTETTTGTDLSAVYIVENNLAAVMSESYGECELGLGTTGNQFYNTLWQQASAQGITVFISAGDAGSAGCDNFDAGPPNPAQFGLQVSGYASTPYNVAVGGTDFNDFSNPATYWSLTNNSTTQASAKSYIPETTWNDSCTNAIFGALGFSTSALANCNNSQLANFVDISGGSGGVSNCTTPTGSSPANCTGGYSKPSWQTGTGVPNDGKRDIPDVSLFASNGFIGSFYLICQSDQTGGGCNLSNEQFLGFGGTSVSSPAFAGIMALVNQQTGSRQGNANYVLYKLAAKETLSECNSTNNPASTCIFNDITMGTNAMPCAQGSPNCTTSAGDTYGVLTGYNAGTGYDLATGLGSVNANNLVTQWSSVTFLPSTTTLNSLTPTTITHGQAVNFSVTVKPQTGTGTPTGSISLIASSNEKTIAAFPLNGGTASGSTMLLPGGTYQVTAHYAGDGSYDSSDSTPVSVTVSKENSQQSIFLVTFDGSGHLVNSDTNTAQYGSQYLVRVNVEDAAGQLCSPFSANQTACPSGTVNLTNNGSPLNPETYNLNVFGYTEDTTVQLSGGTDSVTAIYSGDSSFNTSTVTTPITITQAYTQLSVGVDAGFTGQSTTLGATVTPYAIFGAPPSGTITFYANGVPLSGTVAYSSGKNPLPTLTATLIYTFTISGNYAITASYSGDVNYSSSGTSAQNITIMYPTPYVLVTPYTQTVNYGGTGSVTVQVDPGNKSAYPTGTVTFRDGGQFGTVVAGPTTCTSTKDASGNFACQAPGTFTITSNNSIFVAYSGDSNYPPSYNWAYISMPDFMFSASGGVQVTAGQSQNLTVTFTSLNGLSGTVSNFNCSDLPAETSCTFNPAQVTLPSNGTATTTLTITTAALGDSVKYKVVGKKTINWGADGALMLLAACFAGLPFSRRRAGRIAVALMLVGCVAILLSCGGGSGGTGSGGGGTGDNPVPAITSLNPTQIAAGSQVQSLYVNGTNFLSTSTVNYNGTLHNSSLQSPTQIQVALGPSDVAATGSYPVVVTNPGPGGGASAPVNFSIVTGTPTGYFTPTMNATLGPITHNAQLSMQIQ